MPCSCCKAQLYPQASSFTVHQLTPGDGLSQGSNYFRYEDSRGFMWITCIDALNRYDGKMVKVYNLSRYFSNCPNLEQGYGFAEDGESNIYIGSTRGLYIYHRNKDKFTLQKIFVSGEDEIAMPFGYKNGKVWCFNRQWQLATYDVATKKVTLITQLSLQPLASMHVYQLEGNLFYFHFPFIDKAGNCWMFSNNNVATYNTSNKVIEYPLQNYLFAKKAIIYASAYDSLTNHILIAAGKCFLEYDIYKKTVKEIPVLKRSKPLSIKQVCVGNDFITIMSSSSDIAFLSKDYKQLKWIEPGGIKKYSRAYGPGFDKSGRLWICDDGYGQVIMDFRPQLLNKEPGENEDLDQLLNMGVGLFSELPNGDILIQNNFVQHQRSKKLAIRTFKLPDNYYGRQATDPYRQGIWFYNYENSDRKQASLFFLDKQNSIKKVFTLAQPDTLGTQQDIKVLNNRQVITSFSSGVYWLDEKAKRFTRIPALQRPASFVINLLSNDRIAVSYLDNDMLLAKILPGNRVQVLQKILPGVQSFYLQEDIKHQCYWVGTNNGVYLLDKNFKTFRLFDANNGLAGTYIYGLLLDDDGNAWCSHQHGLSSINTKSFQIINYDKNDGIQDWDFNNRAFYKTSDGTLFFGGINGFNYFRPPLAPFSFYKPEVYVDEILVNNKNYLPDLNANLVQKMELPYTGNNIVFRAIIKDLDNASTEQLIYRLRETNSQWQYLPGNSPLSFSSLAPGDYTLELGCYDKFSDKALLQKTIAITIATPVYRRAWFWALIALVIYAIVFRMINQRKLSKQKAAFNQQMALELQRQKMTADLHDDIGASLSSLQVNSVVANNLIGSNLAQARVVLNKIENQSKDLADKIGDIIWSMKPGKDEFMTMSSRIKNFANDILGATNIDYRIIIDKEIDTAVRNITARKNIVFITKESINNAVKYSNATKVIIQLKLDKERILLSINDDGIGFSVNEITGNGLENMKRRTQELNGIFSIESSPETGTRVNADIPLVP